VSVSSQTFFTITFEIGDLTAEFFVLLWTITIQRTLL
jgi:hypothetical protein